MDWGAERKHFAFYPWEFILRLRYFTFLKYYFKLVQVYILLVMCNRENVLQLHKTEFNYIF